MTENTEQPTCPIEVSSHRGWHWHRCGRPFRNEEQKEAGLCGIHLRAKKTRDAKEAARQTRMRRSQDGMKAAELAAERLRALGIDAELHYRLPVGRGSGEYTGKVIVDPAQVLAILDG